MDLKHTVSGKQTKTTTVFVVNKNIINNTGYKNTVNIMYIEFQG